MAKDDNSIEVEAHFEQNYQVHPTNRYLVARMSMALRKRVYPDVGMTVDQTFDELLALCQNKVRAAIAKEQAELAQAFAEEGRFD